MPAVYGYKVVTTIQQNVNRAVSTMEALAMARNDLNIPNDAIISVTIEKD